MQALKALSQLISEKRLNQSEYLSKAKKLSIVYDGDELNALKQASREKIQAMKNSVQVHTILAP